jgi:hypothetical protein
VHRATTSIFQTNTDKQIQSTIISFTKVNIEILQQEKTNWLSIFAFHGKFPPQCRTWIIVIISILPRKSFCLSRMLFLPDHTRSPSTCSGVFVSSCVLIDSSNWSKIEWKLNGKWMWEGNKRTMWGLSIISNVLFQRISTQRRQNVSTVFFPDVDKYLKYIIALPLSKCSIFRSLSWKGDSP